MSQTMRLTVVSHTRIDTVSRQGSVDSGREGLGTVQHLRLTLIPQAATRDVTWTCTHHGTFMYMIYARYSQNNNFTNNKSDLHNVHVVHSNTLKWRSV